MRSWDGPDVLVEIEKRGPTREAVDGLVVQVEQDGNKIDGRGEAAEVGDASAVSGSTDRPRRS